MSLIFSQKESKITGLKTCRIDESTNLSPEVLEDILFNEFDICRVSVTADNKNIITYLEQLGFPYFFSGAVQRFRINFMKEKIKSYKHPEVEFEQYDGSKASKDQFKSLLRKIFIENALSDITIPYLFNPDLQLESLVSYYTSEYSPINTSSNKAWFAKWKGQYAGLITATFRDRIGDATLAGVIPEFRNKDLFTDIVRFIENYCVENKVAIGYTGARITNAASQKYFVKEGMTPFKNYIVFYVISMLTKSLREPIHISLKNENKSKEKIFYRIEKESRKKFDINFNLCKMLIAGNAELTNKNINLVIQLPVLTQNSAIVVAKFYEEQKLLKAVYYFYKS